MEFIKQEIRNFTWKTKNMMQFTMDDTINISDSLMDMERLVLVKGNVVVEETKALVDRFQIKGYLNYQILYRADKSGAIFDSLNGRVPFVEYINADGTKETDYIEVHTSLNDLTVSMLHSRKISLKALIGIDYQVKEYECFQAVSDIKEAEHVKVLNGSFSMMGLQLQKSEKIRFNGRVEIPSNKPNIYQVIWKSLSLTGTSTKPMDGYVMVNGTLNLFLVYSAEDENMPIQYFNVEIPFEQRVNEEESSEDKICGSHVTLDTYQLKVMPDENREDRLIDIMADMSLELKLYGTEEMKLVKDAYSPSEEMNPVWKKFAVQHLLLRNCAKTRVQEVVDMPKAQSVLQICNVEGSVSIDDTVRTEHGILVEGVISTQLTYLSREENGSLASATFDLPFSYEIDVNGMKEDISYSIVPILDRIGAVQIQEHQIELKAEISLDVLVFTNEMEKAVLDMKVEPMDIEKKRALPCLIGYIVKEGDTLWSIAKQYYTSVETISKINELSGDELHAGDKLLIMKE